jgi:serine/threonine-protein kinase
MGTVFLAHRVGVAGFRKPVALKVVHPHLAREPRFVRMLIDEALLAARIHHPNVVRVEELAEDGGVFFVAMEYVHGASLAQILGRLARAQRRIVIDAAVAIASEIALGLHAAHETTGDDGQNLGVVHRDVKPQNVLVSRAGEVKLIDFGIAKARSHGRRSMTDGIKGTLQYLSPEQARADRVDRRSDVYALGIVLYEMLSGSRLFESESDLGLLDRVRNPRIPALRTRRPEVPAALERAVHRMLELDPARRPATALEARLELLDACPAAASITSVSLGALVGALFDEHLSQSEVRAARGTASLDVASAPTADLPSVPTPEARTRIVDRMSVVARGVDPTLGEPDPSPPTQLARPTRFRPSMAAGVAAIGVAAVTVVCIALAWPAPPLATPAPAPIAPETALAIEWPAPAVAPPLEVDSEPPPVEAPSTIAEPRRRTHRAASMRAARGPARDRGSPELLIAEPGF